MDKARARQLYELADRLSQLDVASLSEQQLSEREQMIARLQQELKQGLAEGFDPEKKRRLYDLIELYRDATDPSDYYDRDIEDPDKVIAMIRSEFGDKIANQVEAGADKMHFTRPGHTSWKADPLGWKKPVDRITKAGKMYKQDSDYMKNTIKARYKNSGKSATEGLAEGMDSLTFWKQEAKKAGGAANIDWYAIGVEHGKQGIVMNPPYGVGGKAVALYSKGLDAGQQGLAEAEVDESNAFTDARMNAIKAGKKEFTVNGKEYKVTGDTSDEKVVEDEITTEAYERLYRVFDFSNFKVE